MKRTMIKLCLLHSAAAAAAERARRATARTLLPLLHLYRALPHTSCLLLLYCANTMQPSHVHAAQ